MTYFESKERYQEFRTAWSNAVTNIKAKRTTNTYPGKAWGTGEECIIHQRVDGWVKREHFLLFNILCGKSLHNGFTPMCNVHKISNGAYINRGFYEASNRLNHYIRQALRADECKEGTKAYENFERWAKPDLDKFLEPFAGTVTIEMLADIPKLKTLMLHYNYGDGKKVFQKIKEHGFVTFDDI